MPLLRGAVSRSGRLNRVEILHGGSPEGASNGAALRLSYSAFIPGHPAVSWRARPDAKLSVAAARTDHARRIIEAQRSLIEMLESLGQPSAQARKMLQVYQSSLGHLEQYEHYLRARRHARLTQTKTKE